MIPSEEGRGIPNEPLHSLDMLPQRPARDRAHVTISDVGPLPEIAERWIRPAEVPPIRRWIMRTRALAADGLVRPDVGELAEILAAVAMDGTRAPRGERVWDVRRRRDGSLVQVKSVWHLPHRRRQNLGDIAEGFAGDIWVVEFERDLSVQSVRTLPGAAFAGRRLRVRDAASGVPVQGWEPAAAALGLLKARRRARPGAAS